MCSRCFICSTQKHSPLGATTDLQPTLVWQPVENWKQGQQVQFRFNTLPWYTRDMPAYRLALGVISGSDVWNIEARHRPSVEQQIDIAPRLPANGTLVELAHIEQPWQMPQGEPQLRQFTRPSVENSVQANFGNQIELFGYGHAQNRYLATRTTKTNFNPLLAGCRHAGAADSLCSACWPRWEGLRPARF